MYGKSSGWKQGRFVPRNPYKYKGNVENIIFRSSWEQSFCQFLDNNPNVLEWASEEISIPYVKPTTGRVHKYFPDYWIKYKDKSGRVIQELIEIKPDNQTKTPGRRGKNKKTQLRESVTYAVNLAKWQAAANFCNKYGMKFRLLTEKELFKK
jgi:hypothetical protein